MPEFFFISSVNNFLNFFLAEIERGYHIVSIDKSFVMSEYICWLKTQGFDKNLRQKYAVFEKDVISLRFFQYFSQNKMQNDKILIDTLLVEIG